MSLHCIVNSQELFFLKKGALGREENTGSDACSFGLHIIEDVNRSSGGKRRILLTPR
ncbi:Hypothetical predicted protein [Xyrichtys novacula]|uniref:Uncharacterized protein n=1 Tax=Xyrichtys novacula TaxID=13765 RepID=A0AAV1GBW1_XYRNO|nr:Hypothetical predicted protein [Xyrichtys novacula]